MVEEVVVNDAVEVVMGLMANGTSGDGNGRWRSVVVVVAMNGGGCGGYCGR